MMKAARIEIIICSLKGGMRRSIFNSHVALRSLDFARKEFRGSLWSLCYFCRNKRLAFYSIVKNL